MYKPTIGLEIHAELATKTKMFCDCDNDPWQIEPNVNVCPICLGHPGTLPKINKGAVDLVLKTGMALNCKINEFSKFDRKNYFYPDLPKAYQISQYDKPLCFDGYLVLPSSGKKIRIRRIHLEEDTGSLAHSVDGKHSLVNFNRAGVPLMELVTEPDFDSAEDVVEFAKEFQLIIRMLKVSMADMEKGQLRIEANVSVAKIDSGQMGTKVEIKNLNSFKSVYDAIDFEIKRQKEILEKGEKVIQETRGWDEAKQRTVSQRSKEEACDYRYFPEPDLPPLHFSYQYLEKIKSEIVELPSQKRERLLADYNLSKSQVEILIYDPFLCDFFEKAVSELKSIVPDGNPEIVYNYLVSDVRGIETQTGIAVSKSKLLPLHLGQLAALLFQKKISSRVAKDVLLKAFETGESPEDIIKREGLSQISSEEELWAIVKDVIDRNQKVWYDYKNGKQNALQFLIGQVMAATKGKADPQVVKYLFKKFLDVV
jgi:aspartyl-tRNA(Asn)/glutamyl-tRNA(Gln) amidotransferase subunit B